MVQFDKQAAPAHPGSLPWPPMAARRPFLSACYNVLSLSPILILYILIIELV